MPKGRGLKSKKDDDERPNDSEARAIDVKIKGAEDGGAMLVGNLDLLKRMQEEKWKTFDWVDAEVGFPQVVNINHVHYSNEWGLIQAALD